MGEVLDLRWRDIATTRSPCRTSNPTRTPWGSARSRIVVCRRTVCDDAELGKVPRMIRRTAASVRSCRERTCSWSAKLLGHRRRTTAGYAHLADAHLIETVEKLGCIIARVMGKAGRSFLS